MFSFFLARRYLFARKSHHTINIISAISVCGIALATTAMVVTLSVFNGFRDMVASFFTAFDPELKVSLVEGKSFSASDSIVSKLQKMPEVASVVEVLEDQALIVGNERQWVVTIKGVDDGFVEQSGVKDILYGDGELTLHADVLEYGVMGIRLASSLGLNTTYEGGLPIYAPRRGERVNQMNPMQSFNCDELYSPGVVFNVNQSKYDAHYIITSLRFAQKLFDAKNRISALEVELKPEVARSQGKKEVQQCVGERFKVEDRYEQQADTFRIMQVEKLIAYLFLSFILLVACFNIIGSLSMLMIDKQDDVDTLRSLGANDQQVRQIFVFEGWLISGFGAAAGIVLGVVLCWVQQTFGVIKLTGAQGAFVVESYPVSVHGMDILLTFGTVLLVSVFAIWLPVKKMTKQI